MKWTGKGKQEANVSNTLSIQYIKPRQILKQAFLQKQSLVPPGVLDQFLQCLANTEAQHFTSGSKQNIFFLSENNDDWQQHSFV